MGAAVWVVLAEIIPTKIKPKAFSIYVFMNWICSSCVALFTLTAIDGLGGVEASEDDNAKSNSMKKGAGILYFIFGLLTLIALIFIQFVVPETKDRTPEEIMNMPIHHTGDGASGGATSNPIALNTDGYMKDEIYGGVTDSPVVHTSNKHYKKVHIYSGSNNALRESLITDNSL